MKRCRVCQEEKPLTDFHLNRKNPDYYQSYCKLCQKVKLKEWYKNNPGASSRQTQKAYIRDPARPITHAIRIRARKQGLPFDLDANYVRELLAATTVCPILGIPLRRRIVAGKRHGPSDNAPSIDRRKPELGYVRGNIAVISQRANRLKNDASLDEVRLSMSIL